MATRTALVAGATGVTGRAVAHRLLKQGWKVTGLVRTPPASDSTGMEWIKGDLLQPESLNKVLANEKPQHVFLTPWLNEPRFTSGTRQTNIMRVNAGVVRNLLAALDHAPLSHVCLVTGVKHYLGPVETWGKPDGVDLSFPAPFREEQGRLPVENFYYDQEDELISFCERKGVRWTVHRPATMVGLPVHRPSAVRRRFGHVGLASTLAVYGTICKEKGMPFVYPGLPSAYNALVDVTDSRLLASQCLWAATHSGARGPPPHQHSGQAFNAANGDVFRWSWMWGELAKWFGIEAAPHPGTLTPLTAQMENAGPIWTDIANKYSLAESTLNNLTSFWHADQDLNRPMDTIMDMTKCRDMGFEDSQSSKQSFIHYFEQMRLDKLIP